MPRVMLCWGLNPEPCVSRQASDLAAPLVQTSALSEDRAGVVLRSSFSFPAGDAAGEEDMLRAAVTVSLETAKDNLKAERKK